MRIPRHNKRKSKAARTSRAEVRAMETGQRHYGLAVEDIDDVANQIKRGKSSFVFRWGKLGIHRILSAVGTVFAAYDSSIKSITFFLPKETGIKMAKSAKSSAWGKKRSGVILLPTLPKKAPPRVSTDDDTPMTSSEMLSMRKGMERRLAVLRKAFDEHMEDDPAKNWDKIQTIGKRMEELEDILAELPTEEDLVRDLDNAFEGKDDKDELRRKNILAELADIERSITTCHESKLKEKVDRLNDLKEQLFQLIPDSNSVDRREALHRATKSLKSDIDAFQSQRSYEPGDHIVADREKMAGLRSRLRTLTAMHKALFGTSYFMADEDSDADHQHVPETEAEAGISPAPDPEPSLDPPRGWEAVKARYHFLQEEIDELGKRLSGPANGENADCYYQRRLYMHEQRILIAMKDMRSSPSELLEQNLLGARVIALREFIGWYQSCHQMNLDTHKARNSRFIDQLNKAVDEYLTKYPNTADQEEASA